MQGEGKGGRYPGRCKERMQNVFGNILILFFLGILWSGVQGSQSGFGGLGVLNASYGAPVDWGH